MAKNGLIKASLLLNYIVFAILLNSVGIVILQVQNQYGISSGDAKFLEGYKDFPVMIASFFAGLFLLRLGYKRSMQIGLVLVALVSVAMPIFPGFAMTKILFAVTGLSFALVKVAAFSTVGLVTHGQKEHLSFMSILEATFMIGLFGGYMLFGVFVKEEDPTDSWVHIYYLLAGLTVIALVLLSISPLDESAVQVEKEPEIWEDIKRMLLLCIKPLTLVFVTSIFMYVLIEQGIQSWLPTYNNKILNIPADLSVKLASIMPLSIALGRFLGGAVLRVYDWLLVLISCLVGATVLLLISLPMASNIGDVVSTSLRDAPLVAYIFPLIGLFLAPLYPALNSLILNALPLRSHAAMTGLIVLFSAAGGTIGSIITGSLFEQSEDAGVFYFILIPIALLATCMIIFKWRNRAVSLKSS